MMSNDRMIEISQNSLKRLRTLALLTNKSHEDIIEYALENVVVDPESIKRFYGGKRYTSSNHVQCAYCKHTGYILVFEARSVEETLSSTEPPKYRREPCPCCNSDAVKNEQQMKIIERNLLLIRAENEQLKQAFKKVFNIDFESF